MKKIAIVTDSNSGITIKEQQITSNLFVLPMPFMIGDKTYFEDIDLSQERFYEILEKGESISTSQPAIGQVTELWDKVLKEYETIIHIPMSSSLSKACESAVIFSSDYKGRVLVVDNQRISVTLHQAIWDALNMIEDGKSAKDIKQYLENDKAMSSIYITVDTLKYLLKGGRVTPSAAALGNLLHIKPVLQIQGGKLDAFAKVIGIKKAKLIMINQMKKDLKERFHASPDTYQLCVSYTPGNKEFVDHFIEDVKEHFPGYDLLIEPLSLSVACHIGPGSFAIAVAHKYKKIS